MATNGGALIDKALTSNYKKQQQDNAQKALQAKNDAATLLNAGIGNVSNSTYLSNNQMSPYVRGYLAARDPSAIAASKPNTLVNVPYATGGISSMQYGLGHYIQQADQPYIQALSNTTSSIPQSVLDKLPANVAQGAMPYYQAIQNNLKSLPAIAKNLAYNAPDAALLADINQAAKSKMMWGSLPVTSSNYSKAGFNPTVVSMLSNVVNGSNPSSTPSSAYQAQISNLLSQNQTTQG